MFRTNAGDLARTAAATFRKHWWRRSKNSSAPTRKRARIAAFEHELDSLLQNFAGRPTPLQFASRLTEHLGGPRIYLKREDLLHTGAHKINNCLGQGLLAVRMGKRA